MIWIWSITCDLCLTHAIVVCAEQPYYALCRYVGSFAMLKMHAENIWTRGVTTRAVAFIKYDNAQHELLVAIAQDDISVLVFITHLNTTDIINGIYNMHGKQHGNVHCWYIHFVNIDCSPKSCSCTSRFKWHGMTSHLCFVLPLAIVSFFHQGISHPLEHHPLEQFFL